MESNLTKFLSEEKNNLQDKLTEIKKEKEESISNLGFNTGVSRSQYYEEILTLGKLSTILKIENFINQPKTI